MFVILSYIFSAKSDAKVLKICRKYLSHEQRSVFEGVITQAKLAKLKNELKRIIDTDADSIRIYEFESLRYASKESIGVTQNDDNIL